jgi:nitrogen fixation protein FixH
MNWGHKLTIVFVLFAAGILTLVTKSMQTKVDMVSNDYYADELKYQQVIDGRKASAQLSAPVRITRDNEQIALLFPPEMQQRTLTGKVLFYRPSDSRLDVAVTLHNGSFSVPETRFRKGHYNVQMEWEADGKQYFQEAGLDIP